MYPILFTIPGLDYPVSSFGVMMALGFLAAYGLAMRELPGKGIDAETASSLLLYIMIGGVLGSKIYFATDMHFRTGEPIASFFFRRDGITWYGGLMGGIVGGALGSWRNGVSLKLVMDAAAPGVAVGQAIGRLGCFLVGDDYGKASDLPWAVAFPEGAPPVDYPVHPTQIYEILWLLPVAAVLHARRKRSPFLFGEYMAANGFGRIFIETLRVNPRVALGLTEPQWIGIGLIVIGTASWLFYWSRDRKAGLAVTGSTRPG
jgi:phosphatidylglycerol:prolipoprotein diacylglycerol transferase